MILFSLSRTISHRTLSRTRVESALARLPQAPVGVPGAAVRSDTIALLESGRDADDTLALQPNNEMEEEGEPVRG